MFFLPKIWNDYIVWRTLPVIKKTYPKALTFVFADLVVKKLWDNENNRWKRNGKTKQPPQNKKTNKDRKEQEGTEGIGKWWELNDFAVNLS